MKLIAEFAKRVNASTFSFSDEFVLEEGGRYFLLNSPLSRYVQKGFFYAGIYLGKFKDGQFFPSFNLLSMLAKSTSMIRPSAGWTKLRTQEATTSYGFP